MCVLQRHRGDTLTVGEEGTTEEAKRGTVSQSEHTVCEEEWEEQSKRVVVQGVEEGGGGRKVHALTHASETSVRSSNVDESSETPWTVVVGVGEKRIGPQSSGRERQHNQQQHQHTG